MLCHGILQPDGTVKPAENILEWGKYMEVSNRRVGLTEFGPYVVSTVFLGIDHGFFGKPLWFETLVFQNHEELDGERYETIQSAWAGHIHYVKKYGGEKSKSAPYELTFVDKPVH